MKPGAKDLMRSDRMQDYLEVISERILRSGSLQDANLLQVATILWAYSLWRNAPQRFKTLWDQVSKRIEEISQEEGNQLIHN